MAVIWEKFALNCCINAIAATTGLRTGEMARLPELDAFQDRIIAEVMAVTEAKGIRLPTPDLPAKIKAQCRKKFNKPSMLQHVEAGRRTEIDALNGALLREAAALGVATPYNEALVALLKGRELHQMRAIHEPDLDYAAWEARIARGEEGLAQRHGPVHWRSRNLTPAQHCEIDQVRGARLSSTRADGREQGMTAEVQGGASG